MTDQPFFEISAQCTFSCIYPLDWFTSWKLIIFNSSFLTVQWFFIVNWIFHSVCSLFRLRKQNVDFFRKWDDYYCCRSSEMIKQMHFPIVWTSKCKELNFSRNLHSAKTFQSFLFVEVDFWEEEANGSLLRGA